MKRNKIEKKVIKKIKPDSKYKKKVEKTIDTVTKKINNLISKKNLPVSVELVGSAAKDTYIKNSLDIDLFLLFPKKISKKEIAKYNRRIAKKVLNQTEESYAEHPYIKGKYNNFQIEIVPCYQVEDISQKMSAVDRTPLHTRYVKKNLKEKQKDDVRLLKQFLKGIRCYGANAEIQGFSGYLCELLIIKYEDFRRLLKKSRNWEKGTKLTLKEGKYPSFDTVLTFIDPVDSERNVASALSMEKFELFIKAAKGYLEEPSITFFFPNPVKPWKLEKIDKRIEKENFSYIGLKVDKPDIIDENLYPQIRKAIRSINDECERYGFKVYDITFHIEKEDILLVIKTDEKPLSDTYTHVGPPTELEENAKEFIQKWKNHPKTVKGPYKKNGRLYVEVKRDYTKINAFLEDNIKELSLGKKIDKKVNQKFEVLNEKKLLTDRLRVFWTEYLDEKMPWER